MTINNLPYSKSSSFKTELIIYFLCAIFIFSIYGNYFRINVFGHDEVHYYENFHFKLFEEGRWINYLLHDILRAIPLTVWSIALVAIAYLFFFLLLIHTPISKAVCALFATSVVSSIPFVSQSLWPATLFPSMVSLLFLLSIRNSIGYKKTYILSGILLFGGLQNLYFMIPFLFINNFLSSNTHARTIFHHTLWWIAGCIAGICTSLIMVFIITGQVGLEVADWRQTKPLHDIQSAISNLHYVIRSFIEHLGNFTSHLWGWFYVLLGSAIILNIKLRKHYIYMLVVIFSVAVSYFAFSLPLSPIIQTRTLLPLYLAIILSLVVFSNIVFFYAVNIFNMTILCCINLTISSAYMNKHKEVTDHYYNSIYRTLDRDASQYSSIVLKGQLPDEQPYAYFFNSAPLMHSVIHALGASSYWDCRIGTRDPRCSMELNTTLKNITAMDGGELLLLIDNKQNIAVLEFLPSIDR